MATVDTQTLERAAVAAWDTYRAGVPTPQGVFSHPWGEVPERPYKRAWRAAVGAAFAALDQVEGVTEDAPALPPPGPNETNTWTDPDATAPGEVVGAPTEGG